MEGSHIILGKDGGGWRDFLDGRAIHCGTQLQLWLGDHWIYARYEIGDYWEREAVLHSVDGERALNRDTMRFRWPVE